MPAAPPPLDDGGRVADRLLGDGTADRDSAFSERVANGCKISSTLDHESARHGFLFPYQRFVSVVRIAATCGRVDIPIGLVATREFGRGSLWAARRDAAG